MLPCKCFTRAKATLNNKGKSPQQRLGFYSPISASNHALGAAREPQQLGQVGGMQREGTQAALGKVCDPGGLLL